MRLSHVRAFVLSCAHTCVRAIAPICATLLATSSVSASIVLGAATGHISGSVSDSSGVDSFTLDTPLIVPGDDAHSDFAESPGMWTNSGAALLTTITTTLIDLRGFTNGTAAIPATISALAEIDFTFTVTESTLVSWTIITLNDPGTFTTVSLSGPGGEVPEGISTLDPGVYTFSGSTGYQELTMAGDTPTQFARFITTLEVIPAPGGLALLAFAGLFGGVKPRHRRR